MKKDAYVESGAHLLQIYCMIALDSQIEKSPSFKVGTQWAGLIAKNSGLFCSPANKSKSVNLKSTLANLNVASQARAKIGVTSMLVTDDGDRLQETEYVDDKFKVLVTVLVILITNIYYFLQ